MTTLSPEAFMAQPADPDEDLAEQSAPLGFLDPPTTPDPLASIADYLRQLVEHFEGTGTQAQVSNALQEVNGTLLEELDDLQAKYRTLYDLLEEIEGIVKPSTSKLANSVREAIGRWRDPEQIGAQLLADHPSHDADVEEWRAYARRVADIPEDTVLDQMNRSQIRSLLGVEQPGTPVAPSVVHA